MNFDYNKKFYSLNGYYKPEYDDLSPAEITTNYIIRKESLYRRKRKTDDAEYLLFAKENINLLVGFFKDKQGRRNINLID